VKTSHTANGDGERSGFLARRTVRHAIGRLAGHDVDALAEVMFVGTTRLFHVDVVHVPRVCYWHVVRDLEETLESKRRRVVERQRRRRRRVVRYQHVVRTR